MVVALFTIGFSSCSSAWLQRTFRSFCSAASIHSEYPYWPKTHYQRMSSTSSRPNTFSIGFCHFLAKTYSGRYNRPTCTFIFSDVETLTLETFEWQNNVLSNGDPRRRAIIIYKCISIDRFLYVGISLKTPFDFVCVFIALTEIFILRRVLAARQQLNLIFKQHSPR